MKALAGGGDALWIEDIPRLRLDGKCRYNSVYPVKVLCVV